MNATLCRAVSLPLATLLCLLLAAVGSAQRTSAATDIETSVSLALVQLESGTVAASYHRAWEWSAAMRRGGAETTATLAKLEAAMATGPAGDAMAAALLWQDAFTTAPLSDARRNTLRRAAQERLQWEGSAPWAAEPLCRAFLSLRGGSRIEDLYRDLLAQLGPDDIANNALMAGGFAMSALGHDRARFLPIVAEAWREEAPNRTAEGSSAQRSEMLARLLLLAPITAPAHRLRFHQWRHGYDTEGHRLAPLPKSERQCVEDAAAWVLTSWVSWEDDFSRRLRDENRQLAWRLLESESPPPRRALAAILTHESGYSEMLYHALTIWLFRDPASFTDDEPQRALAQLLTWSYWRGSALGTLGAPREEGYAGPPVSELRDYIVNARWVGNAERLFRRANDAEIRDAIRASIPNVRRQLDDARHPQEQIGCWDFLLAAKDRDSFEAIARAATSNLPNDDEWENRSAGMEALREIGGELALEAAEAGIRVALLSRDSQLAQSCIELLSDIRGEELATIPYAEELAQLFVENLVDDEVQGNATSAVHGLQALGSTAAPALRKIRTAGDHAQRRIAGELLAQLGEE